MFFLWMEIRYAFYFPKFVGAVISCIFIVFGLQLIFGYYYGILQHTASSLKLL